MLDSPKKLKILRKLSKLCPECGEARLVVISKIVICDNGVSYPDKYEFCSLCEYEMKFKKKVNRGTKLYLLPDEQ